MLTALALLCALLVISSTGIALWATVWAAMWAAVSAVGGMCLCTSDICVPALCAARPVLISPISYATLDSNSFMFQYIHCVF
jgi:hypothetical protein